MGWSEKKRVGFFPSSHLSCKAPWEKQVTLFLLLQKQLCISSASFKILPFFLSDTRPVALGFASSPFEVSLNSENAFKQILWEQVEWGVLK